MLLHVKVTFVAISKWITIRKVLCRNDKCWCESPWMPMIWVKNKSFFSQQHAHKTQLMTSVLFFSCRLPFEWQCERTGQPNLFWTGEGVPRFHQFRQVSFRICRSFDALPSLALLGVSLRHSVFSEVTSVGQGTGSITSLQKLCVRWSVFRTRKIKTCQDLPKHLNVSFCVTGSWIMIILLVIFSGKSISAK